MTPTNPVDPQDLLSALLAEQGFDASHADEAVTRREFSGPAPTGFAQELVWLVDRAEPGNTAYNVAIARRAIGPLDPATLRRSLQEIVDRHEVFRTTFVAGPEYPMQVVHEARPIELEEIDLRASPVEDRAAAARRVLEERTRRPFDFSAEQLLRATLVRIEDQEHFLLLQTSHIVYDGWSGGIVFRELSELYSALAAGRAPAPLKRPPLRYRDYAAWERDRLQGPRLEELLGYWGKQLADIPAALDLPTDRPRAAAPKYEGGQVECQVPLPTLDGLRRLAQDHEATLYMVLLSAFQTVLHRWSGQNTIVTGSGNAGRLRPETEAVVGYLANTLVLRTEFGGNRSFAALLDQVRETCLDAYDHQEIPLEKLVLELRRDRAGTAAPLFQVVLTMQNVTGATLDFGDVKLEPLQISAGATKFDLTLFPAERPDGLRLALQYRSDLFDAVTAERFLGHVRTVLEAAVAAPETPVSRIPLLSAREIEEMAQWNRTEWNEGQPATITSLVEAQARRVPLQTAVIGGDGALTWDQLNRNANQLAHWLIGKGVRAGTPVGLCLDRTSGLVTGLLGILKAGGAYVPLVPDLPPARLAQQLAESGATVAVTAAAQRTLLPETTACIRIDADAAILEGLSAENPEPRSDPDDLAYILFTSGSTGTPKGVSVTHANLVHYVRAVSRRFGLDLDGTREPWHFGTVSTLGADLGHTALFTGLLGGGTVHVIPAAVATDAGQFADWVTRQPLDLLKITPNHLRALLAGPAGTSLLPRRWLVLGGEACPWDLAEEVQRTGRCRVLNHYGPTETTVGVCTYEVTGEQPRPASGTVPIGRPLSNTRTWVRDLHGEVVPVGVPGELFIGGWGVAKGYLGRDDLTAERFLQDSEDSAGRVYRTGDRVRRLPSGDLEFLGRFDDQVKLRGYRVELGEIEAALLDIVGVRHAAVIVPPSDGEPQLVAFVVADAGVGNEAMRTALSARLPQYMVPMVWVRLDALPLNPNGKVNRRALVPPATVNEPDRPGSATEQKLASLWAEVLKRDRVGLHEDFFALGGHSLLAIRLLGRIAKTFGARLPLRTLFDNPTVARLAEVLEPAHPAEAPLAAIWRDVLKREQVGRRENFFTLGGHSLLAIRLLGKIAKQFGVRLTLRTLFDHPTVAELAPFVGGAPETGPGAEPTGTESGGIKRRARTSVNPAATDRSET